MTSHIMCPKCGEVTELEVLTRLNGTWIFWFGCEDCEHSGLVKVSLAEM